MKSLIQFIKESLINEANFQNSEWLKHNKLYSNSVIDILTGNNESQTQLALGKKHAERFIDSSKISDKTKNQLLKLKNANNERKIVENLSAFSQGRTVIIAAHRLSTIQHAHQIAFFEHGTLKELGTHTELIARKGSYYKLVCNQMNNK